MKQEDKIDGVVLAYKLGWISLEEAARQLIQIDPVRFQRDDRNAIDFVLMNI